MVSKGTIALLLVAGGVVTTAVLLQKAKGTPPPPPPGGLVATISSNIMQGTEPLTVNFAASVQGGTPPYTYQWAFGDGLVATEQTPSHVYVAGVYNAMLAVMDSVGVQVSSNTITITVQATPPPPPPPPPPPYTSTLTIADEMKNNGLRIWLTNFAFPSLNAGWMNNLQDFGSGPKIESVQQIDAETVRITGYNGTIEILSQPRLGYKKITIAPNFVPNTFMPGVLPGDVLEHFETIPVNRYGFNATWNLENFDSFGTVILHRSGVDYNGIGTYQKTTASTLFDPSPGIYIQAGWVNSSEFVLFNTNFAGLEASYIYFLASGIREPVIVNVQSADCISFDYTIPTQSLGTIQIAIRNSRYIVGVPCGFGVAFAQAVSTPGGSGTAWMTVGRGSQPPPPPPPPPSLTVSLQADVVSGVAPLTVNFNTVVSGGQLPYQYGWDFGDGNVISLGQGFASESHIFQNPGTYNVVVSVADALGATAQASIAIQVTSTPPPSQFDISVVNAQAGQTSPGNKRIDFSARWQNNATVSKTFTAFARIVEIPTSELSGSLTLGPGVLSQAFTASFQNINPGTYTVEFGARDSAGNLIAQSVFVSVTVV